jgi:two-component system NtrC family sensor kinase
MEYRWFLILSPIALGLVIITQFVLWRYRRERVGRALMGYFAIVFLMVMTNVLELLAESERWTLAWAAMQFPFYAMIPLVWLEFSFSFAAVKIARRRLLWSALCVVPVITTILALTIAEHGFIYSSVVFLTRYGYSTVEPEYGMWFWFNGVFHYVILIFGALVSIRSIIESQQQRPETSIWIIAGIALPLLTNILYLLPLSFLRYKDFTPIAFAVTGVFFFVGVFWQRMLQIVPKARNLVLNTMQQGVLIFDTGGLLVDYNPMAAEQLGIRETHVGRRVRDIPNLRDIMANHEHDVSQAFESELMLGNEFRHYDVFVRPVRDTANAAIGSVLVISDVTLRMKLMEDRMKLAAETQRANDELKETQMRLIHREKLASIGQLSAGLAHEMKNPVSFLQSNLRVLRRKLESLGARYAVDLPDSEIREIREVLDDSEDGFSRILTVVDNLLQFSRTGHDAEKQLYDLNRGIETTLQISKSLMNASGPISVVKEFGDLPKIRAYPGEINQVILNLLTNAIHALRNLLGEEGRIVIRTWADDDFEYCRISNNGPPIDPELMEEIFEPFFSTKESGQGTGLGLSIARDIISGRHGGTITVSSDRMETAFEFRLPV